MITSQLTDKIIIKNSIITRDDYGENVRTFSTFKKVKAGVDFRSGKEIQIDSQLTAVKVIKFTMRYLPSLDESMLIEYDGELYDIRSIEHYGSMHRKTTTFVIAERHGNSD